MTAAYPTTQIVHALARVAKGYPLNGHYPLNCGTVWAGVFDEVGKHEGTPPRGVVLHNRLLALGFDPKVAARIVGEVDSADPDAPPVIGTTMHGITILSRAELKMLPKPTWLVDGHLPSKCLAVLYGPSGIGKSFIALYIACCVATRRAFFGRQVEGGEVVYVIGEGSEGLEARIQAWEVAYNGGRPLENLHIVPMGVDLRQPATPDQLLELLASIGVPSPKLIIIDTLARNMTGDENSTEHMGQLVRQVDVLWQKTGATVLVVHHTGKSGEMERGNGSLRNAAHTMMKLTRDEDNRTITLSCDKQRNAEEFDKWVFCLKPQGESVVLDLAAGYQGVGNLPPMQARVLEVLGWSMHRGGVNATRLRETLGIGTSDESGRKSLFRALDRLDTLALIDVEGDRKNQHYSINDAGRATLRNLDADPERVTDDTDKW